MKARRLVPAIRTVRLPGEKKERLIAGQKLPFLRARPAYDEEIMGRIPRIYMDAIKKSNIGYFVEPKGFLGSHGTADFRHYTGISAAVEKARLLKAMEKSTSSKPNASMMRKRLEASRSFVYLDGVNVPFPRQGVGKALVERVERIARARKADFAYAKVRTKGGMFLMRRAGWGFLFRLGGVNYFAKFF